ncbi:hypothetical protein [Donghicola eburneus]|uniref:hypothetical protein n=1 Tax=Donghicola eburneus TaxID=393278 RepID=UPI000B866404
MVKFINPHELARFPNFGRVTFGHVHYGALLNKGIVSNEFDKQAYKFCIVRNPYARAFSLYSYLSAPPISLFEGSFLDFILSVREGCEPVGPYNSKGLSIANPQSDWVFDEEGRRLVNDVFSINDLSGLEDSIRTRFAVKKDVTLKHLNKSTKNKSLYRALLEHDEIVPMIDEIYARDFTEFGFQTGVAEKS